MRAKYPERGTVSKKPLFSFYLYFSLPRRVAMAQDRKSLPDPASPTWQLRCLWGVCGCLSDVCEVLIHVDGDTGESLVCLQTFDFVKGFCI